MRRCSRGIPSRADVAQHGFRCNPLTDADVINVLVKMCVVINPSSGADDGNRASAELVFRDADDVAVGGGQHRCTAGGEDILTFMLSLATTTRGVPGIVYLAL